MNVIMKGNIDENYCRFCTSKKKFVLKLRERKFIQIKVEGYLNKFPKEDITRLRESKQDKIEEFNRDKRLIYIECKGCKKISIAELDSIVKETTVDSLTLMYLCIECKDARPLILLYDTFRVCYPNLAFEYDKAISVIRINDRVGEFHK